MSSLSWGEMLVVAVLALIVLGPKDMLTSFRAAGRWVGRLQKMARDFTRAMNDAADEAGVGEINKTLKAAANPTKFGTDALKSAAGVGPETKALAEKRNKETKEKFDAALERRKAKMAAEEAAADEDAGMVDETFAAPEAARKSDAPPKPDQPEQDEAKPA